MSAITNYLGTEIPEIDCLDSYIFFMLRKKEMRFISDPVIMLVKDPDRGGVTFKDSKSLVLEIYVDQQELSLQNNSRNRFIYLSNLIFDSLSMVDFTEEQIEKIQNLKQNLIKADYTFDIEIDKKNIPSITAKRGLPTKLIYRFEYNMMKVLHVFPDKICVLNEFLPSYFPIMFFFSKLKLDIDGNVSICGHHSSFYFFEQQNKLICILPSQLRVSEEKILMDINFFNQFSLSRKLVQVSGNFVFEPDIIIYQTSV